jgi:hypothetical protein
MDTDYTHGRSHQIWKLMHHVATSAPEQNDAASVLECVKLSQGQATPQFQKAQRD